MRYFHIQYANCLRRSEHLIPSAPCLVLSGMSWNMPYNNDHILSDCAKRWGTVIVAPEPFKKPEMLHEWQAMTRHYDVRLLHNNQASYGFMTEQVAFTIESDRMKEHLYYWKMLKYSVCVIAKNRPYEIPLESSVKAWIYSNSPRSVEFHIGRKGFQDKTMVCGSNPDETPTFSPTACLEMEVKKEEEGEGADPELVASAVGIRPPSLPPLQ